MLTALRSRIVAFAAMLSLVLLGAASAHGMSPDREEVARQATLLVMGATLADICDTDGAGHVHNCPLCDKLPTAPEATAPDAMRDAVLFALFRPASDLVSGPAEDLGPRAPRGPPAIA